MKYYSEEETSGLTEEGIKKIDSAKSVLFSASIDIANCVEAPANFESLSQEERNILGDEVSAQRHEKAKALEGTQEIAVTFPLVKTDFTKPIPEKDGISYQGVEIGKIKLSFSFNASNAGKNNQTMELDQTVDFKGEGTYAWADWESDPEYASFVNKTVDMSGVTMTAKRIESTPLGAKLYLGMTCPTDWDERDKECFLGAIDYKIVGDGIPLLVDNYGYVTAEDGEDLAACITLNILPSEVSALQMLEITPILSRYSGYDDVPFAEGELTKIPQIEVKGWQEEDTVLTDCTLKFSLK